MNGGAGFTGQSPFAAFIWVWHRPDASILTSTWTPQLGDRPVASYKRWLKTLPDNGQPTRYHQNEPRLSRPRRQRRM